MDIENQKNIFIKVVLNGAQASQTWLNYMDIIDVNFCPDIIRIKNMTYYQTGTTSPISIYLEMLNSNVAVLGDFIFPSNEISFKMINKTFSGNYDIISTNLAGDNTANRTGTISFMLEFVKYAQK